MANRNSLADKLKNINKCDICLEEYNRQEKQPVIICTMHHTICRECMRDLEASRKCPFCRETINFSKIVVNNYILELLPNNPPQANTRTAIPQQMPQIQPGYVPAEPEPARNPPASINYQPLQSVYPPNYFPPAPEHEPAYYIPPQDEEIDRLINQPYLMDDCCGKIEFRLGFNYESDRKYVYFIIFILQFPYLFFDLLISLAADDKACMDTPYFNRAYVLRPWLLAMGIVEACIMTLLFTGAALRLCNAISYSCLKRFQFISCSILVLKILLWLYMQLTLFVSVIQPHCSGGVYAYGLIQTIIHSIFLLIVCCLSTCK